MMLYYCFTDYGLVHCYATILIIAAVIVAVLVLALRAIRDAWRWSGRKRKDRLWCAALLALAVSLSGCASMFTARTEAEYTAADGRVLRYASDKEHEGVDVAFEDGDGKKLAIKVSKSGTPEQAMAAALTTQAQLLQVLQQMLPLLKAAAKIP